MPIKLESQPFQLLALLASRLGEVVTRDEIRQAIWGDGTFVAFDQNINLCVTKVRDALDDDPQGPLYIETEPRKGYRFIAPVAEAEPLRDVAVPDAVPASTFAACLDRGGI